MKVLFTSPSREPETRTTKFSMIPQLALLLIAGLTPEKHEVHIVEEEIRLTSNPRAILWVLAV
jgi:hypothetical protein